MYAKATPTTQPAALTVLRVAVAITCVAAAWQSITSGGPVFSWLFMNVDLSEVAAAQVDRAGSFALVAAVPFLFTRWCIPAAAFVSLWLLVSAIAQSLVATHLPWLVLPAQAARIVAPLALLWPARAGVMLRGAIALTFAAHGIEAILGHPLFVDYLIRAFGRAGLELGQPAAEGTLLVIGVVDLLVAVLVLLPQRMVFVALYMALWGFATASARMVFAGLEAWPDTLIRVTNGAVPLTLALIWVQQNRGAKHEA